MAKTVPHHVVPVQNPLFVISKVASVPENVGQAGKKQTNVTQVTEIHEEGFMKKSTVCIYEQRLTAKLNVI